MSILSEGLKRFINHFRTPPIRIVRVKFLGWENEALRSKFHGSVELYEQQLQTGRTLPRAPSYLQYVKGTAIRELPGIGTPPGSELEIAFCSDKLSEDRIHTYLREVGLLVDETTWRVVKDKASGWFIGVA
ncbi:MAG: hypothetical protein AAB974_01145 [Patescibacteria group bacterium]